MDNKPRIMIGHPAWGANCQAKILVREICLGVEEEGCLYETYETSSSSDCRFSPAGICIIIERQRAAIYVEDIREGTPLLEMAWEIPVQEKEYDSFRRIGCNAGRYLKQLPLRSQGSLHK